MARITRRTSFSCSRRAESGSISCSMVLQHGVQTLFSARRFRDSLQLGTNRIVALFRERHRTRQRVDVQTGPAAQYGLTASREYVLDHRNGLFPKRGHGIIRRRLDDIQHVVQNAAALRASEDARMKIAYRRAVRYLRSKGLNPLTDEELKLRGEYAAKALALAARPGRS